MLSIHLGCPNVRENKDTIKEVENISLSKLKNKKTSIFSNNPPFVNFMKTLHSCSIAFGKECVKRLLYQDLYMSRKIFVALLF